MFKKSLSGILGGFNKVHAQLTQFIADGEVRSGLLDDEISDKVAEQNNIEVEILKAEEVLGHVEKFVVKGV